MPDPRTPSDYESASTPVETTSTDDGFNRRLGLGLVISIGANVLLLQGAGLLAKNMSLNKPNTGGQVAVVKIIPKSDVIPSPTPTPVASPTPKTPEKVAVKPTPNPRTPPTPKPERVRPTPKPKPIRDRNIATPPPTPDTVPTPPPAVATPKPAENAAATTAATTPVRSAESPRQSSASNSNVAKGTSKPAPALANRTSSTATPEFKTPTFESAPVQHINDLAAPTLAGAFKAAIIHSAGASSLASATNNASPETITTNTSVTTSQAVTHSGHVSPGTQRVAVLTARPSSSAADTFVLPTTGGTAKPGKKLAAQGNSASSTVAAISASSRTALATGGNGSEPEAIVNAGASAVTVGPVGVNHPGHPYSKAIGATLADIGHKGGIGAGTGVSLSATAIGGTNSGGGMLKSAGAGTSNASYGGGAGHGSGAGLAGNGTSLDADTTGGGGGGFGGGSPKGGNGRSGKGIGPHAGNIAGGGVIGGKGSGDVGLDNGSIGGGGKGGELRAGAITGGTADGIATTNHSGPVSNGTSIKAVTSSGGGKSVVGATKEVVTDAHATDKEAGRTFSATYRSPSTPAIPESLKTQTFDVTATVRAVISATGQVRASITKSCGYPALDAEAVNAVSNLRVTKVAYENGSPASDTHEFNFTFHNKG